MKRLCAVLSTILLFASWFFPLLISESYAESLEWVRRYSTPSRDSANALAVDAQGNVCVTGESQGVGTDYDYATMIYNPAGDRLWAKRYNGPGNASDKATALAVDAQGNICITGESEGVESYSDYGTVKYSPGGNRLWAKRYNGAGNDWDGTEALVVDSQGNVYVAGWAVIGIGSGWDYVTIKYGPSGNRLWIKRYNGPGNSWDSAYAIGVDAQGNVYVTGGSVGASLFSDFATIKYGPNGDRLWVRRYNGAANDWDQAFALAIDSEGNVYVTGQSATAGSGYDYTTIKYSPAGVLIWAKRYNGPGNGDDVPTAIAVDAQGNAYVTGSSTGVDSYSDYTTIKYGPSGDRLWAKRYNGPGNGDDTPTAIAVDAQGNAYVTGYSPGAGSGGDYATIKYSPSGERLWVQRYNGPGNGDDSAHAIALDAQGNVYVTGESEGEGSGSDYATIKYSQ